MNRDRMAEIKHRISSRYPRRLMSDTKWREVWTLITAFRQRIRMTYADSDEWNAANSTRLHGPFPDDYVLNYGIRDPGIGGPFRYFEILAIEIPKLNNDFEEFFIHLDSIGLLPVVNHESHIEIIGYRE